MPIRPHARLRTLLLAAFTLAIVISAQTSRHGTLSITIRDAQTGEPTPARLRLTDASGQVPDGVGMDELAVLWGRFDRPEGFALLPEKWFPLLFQRTRKIQ